jgi:hypothetical protein
VTAAGGSGVYEFSNDDGATWTGITANPHTFIGNLLPEIILIGKR